MNPFHDYWLRGSTEQEVTDALAAAGIPTLPSIASSYDPIGVILRPTGEVDPEGNPVMAPLDGWHANLRLRAELTPEQQGALSPVLIEAPQNPSRVWG